MTIIHVPYVSTPLVAVYKLQNEALLMSNTLAHHGMKTFCCRLFGPIAFLGSLYCEKGNLDRAFRMTANALAATEDTRLAVEAAYN